MQCGSTGLGKTALKMNLVDESKMTKLPPTRPPEGSLIMYCKTHDPVIWNVWIGIEPEDMGDLLKLTFNRKTISFAVKSIFKLVMSKISFGKKSKQETSAPVEKMETA